MSAPTGPPAKPPMKAGPHVREPRSIRFNEAEWAAIRAEAAARGVEPSRFCRQLSLTGLSMLRAQAALEASGRRTA